MKTFIRYILENTNNGSNPSTLQGKTVAYRPTQHPGHQMFQQGGEQEIISHLLTLAPEEREQYLASLNLPLADIINITWKLGNMPQSRQTQRQPAPTNTRLR